MIQTNFQSTQSRDLYCKHAIEAPLCRPTDLIVRIYRIQELVSFRTQHELNLSENSIDSYAFHVFAFVMDPSTNLPVDIAQFAIADSFDGLTISSHTVNITKNFTYNTGGGSIMVEVVARALEVEISRSKFMRGLTMSMFATNWALTIASAYIVFTAVTKGRVDFMVVILYGSMGMAILGIQKFYINPPPFGALLGMFRSARLFHSLITHPPRHGGTFLTGHHRGRLFHDVAVHRDKVISIDQRATPKSREGLIPQGSGVAPRIGRMRHLYLHHNRFQTVVIVSA